MTLCDHLKSCSIKPEMFLIIMIIVISNIYFTPIKVKYMGITKQTEKIYIKDHKFEAITELYLITDNDNLLACIC